MLLFVQGFFANVYLPCKRPCGKAGFVIGKGEAKGEAAIQLQVLLDKGGVVGFGDAQGFVEQGVIAAQIHGFFYVFFYDGGSLKRHLAGGFVGMDEPGHAQQRAAKIAHHDDQHVGERKGIDLPEYGAACAAAGFAVVVGAKLVAVCADAVGVAPMAGFVVGLALGFNVGFDFFGGAHGIGVGNEAAAFVFELGANGGG